RLARLPAPARELLRAASVFGQSFWPAALARAMPSHDKGQPPDELLQLLLEREWLTLARRARFAGQTELNFRHALIREAAYALLDEDARSMTHRAAAEWLEEAGERDAAVLAEHWEIAGELSRASVCFQRAAQQALEANDLSAISTHAERSIACGASDLTLAHVRLLQAEAHNWRAEHERAAELAREAMALFEAHGVDATHTANWTHAVDLVTWACAQLGQADEVERLGRELLRHLQGNPSGLTVSSLSHILWSQLAVGRLSVASAIMDTLNEPAVSLIAQDPAAAAMLESARGMFARADSQHAASLQHFERAVAHAADTGNDRLLFMTNITMAAEREAVGDYELAEKHLLVAADAMTRLGIQNPTFLANFGLVRLGLGQVTAAEALLRAGLQLSTERGERLLECYCLACLGRVLLLSGQADAAEPEARAALAVSEGFPTGEAYGSAVLARALFAQGRTAEAEEAARRAFEVLERGGVEDGEAFIRLSFAEVLYGNGRWSAARDAIRSAADHLLARAADLDEELRRKFLTRVPENARTLQLASEWGCELGERVAS
ncbi:MAG TPA: hypothetical protein VI072_13075, partial [Polyangiaceae bacterium]